MTCTRWSRKSKSTWNRRASYGIGEVVRPRAVTYSGTCHQWLSGGASAIRTLPTIWTHMCSVDMVGSQSRHGSSGQAPRGSPADPSPLIGRPTRTRRAMQLGDPLPQAAEVLGVVVAARLADPPGRLFGRVIQFVPGGDHHRPAGVGLDPGHVPWLVRHRRQEDRRSGRRCRCRDPRTSRRRGVRTGPAPPPARCPTWATTSRTVQSGSRW